MNYRVYVERNIVRFGLTVWLSEGQGSRSVLHTHDGRQVEFAESASYPDQDDYFCRIPEGAEHALLGELARVLGAVEHPEQLRRDFEHIRGRYDTVVDHLIHQADLVGSLIHLTERRSR